MTKDSDRYGVELEAGPRVSPGSGAPLSETPFAIAIFGDFSGRAHPEEIASGRLIAERRPIRVDRDSVDEAITRMAPTLRLSLASTREPIEIRFSRLDDFHPDALYERLPHLQPLRDTRDRLSGRAAGGPALEPPPPRATAGAGGLLDQILNAAPPPPGAGAVRASADPPLPVRREEDDFAEFVRRAVEPHRIAGADPRAHALLAEADAMITAEMRAVLHHPAYQRLESCWRGVDFLARRLDTDDMLRLYLVDVSKDELVAALSRGEGGPITSSAAYELVTRRGTNADGGAPWTLIVGLYDFGSGSEDVTLLGRLAQIGEATGAPWVSAATPALVGTPSFGTTPDVDDWATTNTPEWDALRATTQACYAGLVAPRLLLRLPYGENGDPCEVLSFEEFEPGVAPPHEQFLWGNGGLACALLLGEAFDRSGWALRPELEVAHLPLHVARVDGELTATPCAEGLLSDRALRAMLDRGVMPLVSRRDADVVRVARFQSIARPFAPLAGRWTVADDV